MRYLILFLLLTSCSIFQPREEEKTVRLASTESVTPGRVYGVVRRIHTNTSCKSGPNPIWLTPTAEPREGAYLRLPWVIEAVRLSPHPRHSVALLVSFRPLSEPLALDQFGLPGCRLMVHPDITIPASSNPDDLFYYYVDGGRGWINLLCAPGSVGTRAYCQIVVSDSAGVSRLSSAIEIVVGSGI